MVLAAFSPGASKAAAAASVPAKEDGLHYSRKGEEGIHVVVVVDNGKEVSRRSLKVLIQGKNTDVPPTAKRKSVCVWGFFSTERRRLNNFRGRFCERERKSPNCHEESEKGDLRAGINNLGYTFHISTEMCAIFRHRHMLSHVYVHTTVKSVPIATGISFQSDFCHSCPYLFLFRT